MESPSQFSQLAGAAAAPPDAALSANAGILRMISEFHLSRIAMVRLEMRRRAWRSKRPCRRNPNIV
jgi:hypothetical protein